MESRTAGASPAGTSLFTENFFEVGDRVPASHLPTGQCSPRVELRAAVSPESPTHRRLQFGSIMLGVAESHGLPTDAAAALGLPSRRRAERALRHFHISGALHDRTGSTRPILGVTVAASAMGRRRLGRCSPPHLTIKNPGGSHSVVGVWGAGGTHGICKHGAQTQRVQSDHRGCAPGEPTERALRH